MKEQPLRNKNILYVNAYRKDQSEMQSQLFLQASKDIIWRPNWDICLSYPLIRRAEEIWIFQNKMPKCTTKHHTVDLCVNSNISHQILQRIYYLGYAIHIHFITQQSNFDVFKNIWETSEIRLIINEHWKSNFWATVKYPFEMALNYGPQYTFFLLPQSLSTFRQSH